MTTSRWLIIGSSVLLLAGVSIWMPVGNADAAWVVNSLGQLEAPTPAGQILGQEDVNPHANANASTKGNSEDAKSNQDDKGNPHDETSDSMENTLTTTKTNASNNNEHAHGGTVDIKATDGKLKIKVKDQNQEIEQNAFDLSEPNNATETDSLEIDESVNKNKVTVRSKDNAAYVIQNKLAAKSNFPLRVNLDTNELIVVTPHGAKTVTVLPDAAVQHMLAANVLDQLGGKGGLLWLAEQPPASPSATPEATSSGTPSATPSATPSPEVSPEVSPEESPSATPSATPTPEVSPTPEVAQSVDNVVNLTTTDDGTLVYEITGVKYKKLLGVRQITLERTAVVSAETGELVGVRQDFLTRLLDILSV